MRKLARETINGSMLRSHVEPLPGTGLGTKGEWTWKPVGRADRKRLDETSPTTEYSSVEANE